MSRLATHALLITSLTVGCTPPYREPSPPSSAADAYSRVAGDLPIVVDNQLDAPICAVGVLPNFMGYDADLLRGQGLPPIAPHTQVTFHVKAQDYKTVSASSCDGHSFAKLEYVKLDKPTTFEVVVHANQARPGHLALATRDFAPSSSSGGDEPAASQPCLPAGTKVDAHSDRCCGHVEYPGVHDELAHCVD